MGNYHCNDDIKVSVIVTSYNTKRYLEKCLQSIINQTYKCLEIVIIDDGSKDGSIEIISRYEKIDPRIIVFQKENQGVGSARNDGLERISGQYFIFCDSDDYFEPEAIDFLLTRAREVAADIVVGGYYVERESIKQPVSPHVVANGKMLASSILEGKNHGGLCNKLIKSELVNGLRFQEDIDFMEDYLFLVRLCIKNDIKVTTTESCIYNYVQRKNSYTVCPNENSIKTANKVVQLIKEEASAVLPELSINSMLSFNAELNIRRRNKNMSKSEAKEFRKRLLREKTGVIKFLFLVLALYHFRFPLNISSKIRKLTRR